MLHMWRISFKCTFPRCTSRTNPFFVMATPAPNALLRLVVLILDLSMPGAACEAVVADVPVVPAGEARHALYGRPTVTLHHHICARLQGTEGGGSLFVFPLSCDLCFLPFLGESFLFSCASYAKRRNGGRQASPTDDCRKPHVQGKSGVAIDKANA